MLGFVLAAVALLLVLQRISALQQQLDATNARVRRLEDGLASRPARTDAAPSTAIPVISTPAVSPHIPIAQPVSAPAPATPADPAPTVPRPATRVEAPRDLEEQIGSRWMLVVGAFVLVLGVAFFVKYAFDNHWINETARVAIGTVAGVAAWIAGLRFAASGYPTYGRIVAGGGLAMVYVSAYAAGVLYAIVSPAMAFAWMAGASAVTAVTADRQRSIGLALMAIALAYVTPFLVGSGRDQHVVLFVYDTTLAAATLALVRRHRWPLLGPAAFWLTWTTFASWASRFYAPQWYASTEIYLTVFTGLFIAVRREYRRDTSGPASVAAMVMSIGPVLYYIASVAVLYDHSMWLLVYFIACTAVAIGLVSESPEARLAVWAAVALPFFTWSGNHVLTAWYIATLATAAAIYLLHLAAQFGMLQEPAGAPRDAEVVLFHANGLGLFAFTYLAVSAHSGSTASLAAMLAAWNAALAWVARTRAGAFVPHALALAFAFTAIAIAIQLTGPWITVAWAAEGFAVLWIGLHMRQAKLRYGGAALIALATARLVVLQFDQTLVTFRPVLNSRTAAGVFIVALMYGVAGLYRRDVAPDREDDGTIASWIVAANLLTLGLITADINSYWRLREEDVRASFARQLSVSLAWAAYAMALITLGFRRRSTPLRYLALAVFGVTVAKMFAVDLLELGGIYRITGFVVLGIVLLVASFLYQRRRAREDYAGS